MDYKMDELLPIVGRLAEKYTALESTSVSYETAEQLMEAVLYCIREAEQMQANPLVHAGGLSARQAYEIGAAAVEEKTRAALALYNETMKTFDCYGNRCLYDTFQIGLPEFFKRYDTKFAPQETLLTLDYPLLRDFSGQTGIDRIYGLIACVRLEQVFLNGFPGGAVKGLLSRSGSHYQDSAIENLCGTVLLALAGHILTGEPLSEQKFDGSACLKLHRVFVQEDLQHITERLEGAIADFIQDYYGGFAGLAEYLAGAMRDTAFRLKTAAECGTLSSLL